MYGDFPFELVGTCTRDREFTKLRSGQDRVVISVACNRPVKDRDTGEYKEKTTWVRVALFGDRARSAAVERCKRGMPVYIRGTVESYQEDINGRSYTMYNFRPDVVRPLLSGEQLDAIQQMRSRDRPASEPQSDMPSAGMPSPDEDGGAGMFED